MKTLKYYVVVFTGLAAITTAYGHTLSNVKTGTIKPTSVSASHTKTSKMKTSSKLKTSLSVGIVSAFPPTTQDLQARKAAYAQSDAFYKEAMSLFESGDLIGAEAACFSALDAAPIIRGQRLPVPFVSQLLGQIYLKDGQYENAVKWLQADRPNTAGGSLDLDLALAYIRLGDFKHAQEYYSEQATLRYYPQGDTQDLPGTDSPNNLEASILLARGLDAYLEHRFDDALPDLLRGNKLAPNNALIAFHCARILSQKGRFAEASPLYDTAAATGRGIIGAEARRRSTSAQSVTGVTPQTKQ